MDLICSRCGEPWALHCVNEEPESFVRSGAAIVWCPCCPGRTPICRERGDAIQMLGEISVGDDCGHAVDLQDFDL